MVQLTKEEDSKVNFSRDTLRLAGDVGSFLPFPSKVSYGPDFWFCSLMFPFIHGLWTEVRWVILIQVILCQFKTVNTLEWKMSCNLLLKLHWKMFWV